MLTICIELIPGRLVAYAAENVAETETVTEYQDRNGFQKPVVFEEKNCPSPQMDTYYYAAASSWTVYRNLYFYNQMNENQKALYNKLDNMCMEYLISSKNANYRRDSTGNVVGGLTDYIEYEGINHEDALMTARIFKEENPQYFFLESVYGYFNNTQTSGCIAVGIYEDFVDGIERTNRRVAFQTVLNSWMAVIKAVQDPVEKEKAAYDLIMDNTVYLENKYDQSCLSVFLEKKSVCTGYAQALLLLCNGAGIENIAVTSNTHMWNKVKLFNNWYNVDCTWDDGGSADNCSYIFFNISDKKLLELDSWEHTLENRWNHYSYTQLPECIYDTVIRIGDENLGENDETKTVKITGVYIPDNDAVMMRAGAIIDTLLNDITYECTVIDYDYAKYGTDFFPEVKKTTDKNDNWMEYKPSHPGTYGFCWRAYRNGQLVSEYGASRYFEGNKILSAKIYVPDRTKDTLDFGMVYQATTKINVRIQWFLYRPDDKVYEAILADGLIENIGEWQKWSKKPGRYWIMCRVTAVNNPESTMCWGVEVQNGKVID